MSKHCPSCGTENPEDEFWCNNCNAKLVESISINKEEAESYKSENITTKVSLDSNLYVQKTSRNGLKILIFIIVGFVLIIVIAAFVSLSLEFDFSGINCKINEDFWFEGNYLNTSDGWTFTITKVKDYTLNGIVLGLKTYTKNDFPYRPINIFSPIDLVIGIDDVMNNPEKYPYYISYDYRGYWIKFLSKSALDSEYMRTHMGNNHIIPHNENVLNELQNISINDIILIEGSLVDLYGVRENENYEWNTDMHIGNYNCEIILVDLIIIEG